MLRRSIGPFGRSLLVLACCLAPLDAASRSVVSAAWAQPSPAYALQLPAVANAYRPVLTPIVSPDTVVVSGALAQALQGYDAATGVLTFTQTLTEPTAIAVGQVLAGGPQPAAPVGLLRRVTAVESQPDHIIVQTQAATLTDALIQGDLRFSQTLTAADVLTPSLPAGVSLQPIVGPIAFPAITLNYHDVVLVDGDGKSTTTDDQIRLSGEIELQPNLTLNARVAGGQLHDVEFSVAGSLTAHLKPKLGVTLDLPVPEKRLMTIPLVPFLVPVGVVPVPVVVQIGLYVGAKGSLDATVELADVQTTARFDAGARYLDGSVTTTGHGDVQAQIGGFSPGVGASFMFYMAPRLEVSIAEVATVGPSVDLRMYVKSEVKTYDSPWWTVSAGLEVPIDFRFDVLGYNLGHWVLPKVVDVHQTLAESPHNDLLFVTLNPPTPAHLALMEPVRLSFLYVTDETAGVQIWALPFSGGAHCCAYSPSTLMSRGARFTDRSITLLAGSAHVDEIRLEMWSADHTRLLKDVRLAVDYGFGP